MRVCSLYIFRYVSDVRVRMISFYESLIFRSQISTLFNSMNPFKVIQQHSHIHSTSKLLILNGDILLWYPRFPDLSQFQTYINVVLEQYYEGHLVGNRTKAVSWVKMVQIHIFKCLKSSTNDFQCIKIVHDKIQSINQSIIDATINLLWYTPDSST